MPSPGGPETTRLGVAPLPSISPTSAMLARPNDDQDKPTNGIAGPEAIADLRGIALDR